MNAADAAATAVPYRGGKVADAPSRNPQACAASGCPCRGTVDLGGGGRAYCAWHAWSPPDRSSTVTAALLDQQDLVALIGELGSLYQRGKSKEALARARQAWAMDPTLQPTTNEVWCWRHYLWRLREELSFRVETRATQPTPIVRQCDAPTFSAMFGKRAEADQ